MIFFFKEYSYKITRIFWLVSHASRRYTHEIHNIFRNVRELKCVAYTQKFADFIIIWCIKIIIKYSEFWRNWQIILSELSAFSLGNDNGVIYDM